MKSVIAVGDFVGFQCDSVAVEELAVAGTTGPPDDPDEGEILTTSEVSLHSSEKECDKRSRRLHLTGL
jgi:hypothetical protein